MTEREKRLADEARSEETSQERLAELAKDKCWEIRKMIAEEADIPKKVLLELARDPERQICEIALERIRTLLPKRKTESDVGVCRRLAEDLNTTGEVLVNLAKDKSADVRVAVAKNANTFIETLIELAKDSDVFVCVTALDRIQTLLLACDA